jgi:hypothetical protein
VKFGSCQKMSFLARWAWLLLTSHHGLVVAMPVAAATFRTVVAIRALLPSCCSPLLYRLVVVCPLCR